MFAGTIILNTKVLVIEIKQQLNNIFLKLVHIGKTS